MSGTLAFAVYLIILTTKLVEKYKIHKNFTRLKNISITKEVGNDFQLQYFNFQNMEAKVSIEDDLCLEDIEEREGLSHNDEKFEASENNSFCINLNSRKTSQIDIEKLSKQDEIINKSKNL